MRRPLDPSKELRLLLAFFGDSRLPLVTPTAPEDVPQPYRDLLVHRGHMTETLERYHGSPVRVHPYVVHTNGDMYGRRLDLALERDGTVVMTGLMLFNMSLVRSEIRDEIRAARIPLGRILIQHGVLREVTGQAYLKVDANDPLLERFGLTQPLPAFGRLATIFCDDLPAVDLLEIVRPH